MPLTEPPSDTLLPYFNMFHLAPSPSFIQFILLYRFFNQTNMEERDFSWTQFIRIFIIRET
jgi:hypothetical protein